MKLRQILLLLIFLPLIHSCRKESEIINGLNPGKMAAVSAFRLLSLLHISEEIAFKRNDGFFTSQALVAQTDFIYSDGDPLEFSIDFGAGVVCTDGIMRKGKCHIKLIDSAYPKMWFGFNALAADSFAISAKTGWEFITGNMEVNRQNTINSNLNFNIQSFNVKGELIMQIEHADTMKIQYFRPINSSKNGEAWLGEWNVQYGSENIVVSTIDLLNNGSCRSNWNRGEMKVLKGSEEYNIIMDPFGNAACDQVYKVSHSKGMFTDEMTFDAW